MQFAHRGVVALLGGFDCLLGQVIAQDVFGVDRVHAHTALRLVVALPCAARQVVSGPGVEAGEIGEIVAQACHGLCGRAVAEFAEEPRVIHRAALHQLQQALHQGFVALIGTEQAQALAHQVEVVRLVQGQEQPQGFP